MGILSCIFFLNKALNNPNWYGLRGLVSLTILLVLNTGCSEVPLTAGKLPALLPDLSTDGNFQFSVTPSSRPGVYAVAGTTNLPNKTRIAVAAIRYLQPGKDVSQNPKPNLTYSILAYQDVKVNKGKWQTTLNLWKVAPSGKFQEAWQLEQSKLGISLKSEPEVLFLATVEPTDSLSELESLLQKQGIKLVSNIVRNTVEGEQFVQSSQLLTVGLPAGQTTPPKPRPNDLNGGWGPRYLLIDEPPNTNKFEQPDKRRTDAPISPNEYLQ